MSLTLVILAAGMAKRYGALKQLTPVGPQGNAILDYSIYDAINAGFEQIVIVTRSDIYDVVKDHIDQFFGKSIVVDYVFQNEHESNFMHPAKPLGTGHALLCTKRIVKNNFAVINADDFYGYEAIHRMAQELNQLSSMGILGAYQLKNTLSTSGAVSRAICDINGQNHLVSINESEKLVREGNEIVDLITSRTFVETTPVSMNLWGFDKRIFDYFEKGFEAFKLEYTDSKSTEYYIPTVVSKAIEEGEIIKTFETTSEWFGLTYIEDTSAALKKCQELARSGKYPLKLGTN